MDQSTALAETSRVEASMWRHKYEAEAAAAVKLKESVRKDDNRDDHNDDI